MPRLIYPQEGDLVPVVQEAGCDSGPVSLVPKIAGSNPAEAVGYFGRKNP